jgi:hypothetical protein
MSVKHLLWHGNAEEALERLGGLIIELDLLRAFSPAADKLRQGIGEFETYIRNNIEFIPNFTSGNATVRANHQYSVCGIHDQSGRQQAVRQEAADAVDAAGRTLTATDADQSP